MYIFRNLKPVLLAFGLLLGWQLLVSLQSLLPLMLHTLRQELCRLICPPGRTEERQ